MWRARLVGTNTERHTDDRDRQTATVTHILTSVKCSEQDTTRLHVDFSLANGARSSTVGVTLCPCLNILTWCPWVPSVSLEIRVHLSFFTTHISVFTTDNWLVHTVTGSTSSLMTPSTGSRKVDSWRTLPFYKHHCLSALPCSSGQADVKTWPNVTNETWVTEWPGYMYNARAHIFYSKQLLACHMPNKSKLSHAPDVSQTIGLPHSTVVLQRRE